MLDDVEDVCTGVCSVASATGDGALCAAPSLTKFVDFFFLCRMAEPFFVSSVDKRRMEANQDKITQHN